MQKVKVDKAQKAPYAAPTLQKQQLIEEVLGQSYLTTHGDPNA